jgi:hypothetical protein
MTSREKINKVTASQDDGLVRGLQSIPVGVPKTQKSKKSQPPTGA